MKRIIFLSIFINIFVTAYAAEINKPSNNTSSFDSVEIQSEEDINSLTPEELRDKTMEHGTLGLKYLDNNLFKEAEKEFLIILNYEPENLLFFDFLSQCYMKSYQFDKLIEISEKGIKISLKNNDTRYIGLLYSNLAYSNWYGYKNFDKAIKLYNTVINKYMDNRFWNNPTDDRMKYFLYNYLGLCHYYKKEYQKALVNIEKSLEYTVNCVFFEKDKTEIIKSYYFISYCYYKLKNYESGKKYAEMALKFKSYSDYAKQLSDMCKNLINFNDYVDEFLKNTDNIISLNTNYIQDKENNNRLTSKEFYNKAMEHGIMGLDYLENYSLEEAEKELLSVLKYSPDNLAIYNYLSDCYIKSRQYEKLKSILEKGIEISQKNNDKRYIGIFYSYLAYCYWFGYKNYDKAIELYKIIIDKYMDNCFWNNPTYDINYYFLFNYLGCCYFYKNEYQEAVVNLEKSLKYYELLAKTDNESIKNYYFISKCYYELNDYKPAKKYAEMLLKINSDNKDAKEIIEKCKEHIH